MRYLSHGIALNGHTCRRHARERVGARARVLATRASACRARAWRSTCVRNYARSCCVDAGKRERGQGKGRGREIWQGEERDTHNSRARTVWMRMRTLQWRPCGRASLWRAREARRTGKNSKLQWPMMLRKSKPRRYT